MAHCFDQATMAVDALSLTTRFPEPSRLFGNASVSERVRERVRQSFPEPTLFFPHADLPKPMASVPNLARRILGCFFIWANSVVWPGIGY